MRPPCPQDVPEWEQIAALYRQGVPASRIAWAVGRTDSCVRARLKALGLLVIPPRQRSPFSRLTPGELARLYQAEALTLAQIGARYGVCESWVSRRFRALGIPVGRGWRRKPFCRRGHARTGENLDASGHCRLCRRGRVEGAECRVQGGRDGEGSGSLPTLHPAPSTLHPAPSTLHPPEEQP